MNRQKGFALPIVLSVVLLVGIGFVLISKNFKVRTTPKQKPSLPTTTTTPTQTSDTTNWKTYRNEKYEFEIKTPSTWEIKERRSDITLGDKTTIYQSSLDPEKCRGDCNIIDSAITKTVNGTATRYLKGWWGSIGGNTPQSYASYVIPQNEKFLVIQLQELPFSTLDIAREKVGIISEENIKTFDQILSTFKFIEENNVEGRACGGPVLTPCSAGYTCQITTVTSGDLKETGGKCVKN